MRCAGLHVRPSWPLRTRLKCGRWTIDCDESPVKTNGCSHRIYESGDSPQPMRKRLFIRPASPPLTGRRSTSRRGSAAASTLDTSAAGVSSLWMSGVSIVHCFRGSGAAPMTLQSPCQSSETPKQCTRQPMSDRVNVHYFGTYTASRIIWKSPQSNGHSMTFSAISPSVRGANPHKCLHANRLQEFGENTEPPQGVMRKKCTVVQSLCNRPFLHCDSIRSVKMASSKSSRPAQFRIN